MANALLILVAAGKLWMLVDAWQSGRPLAWLAAIAFLPGGELVYFGLVKAPQLGWWRGPRFERKTPIETLRYRYRENPCLDHEAALARRLFDDGEITEARELYERTLAKEPAFLRAIYGRGLCQRQMGEHAAAAETFRQLLDRDRGYADYRVWRDLGAALEESGQGSKALEILEQLVRGHPRLEHVVAWAELLVREGRETDATAVLEEALEDHRQGPRHLKRLERSEARQAKHLRDQLHRRAV
jgi:tetratricopeptide (TPR) repeat protein